MGSVVVPAHDEASVIRRTLQPLVSLTASNRIDLVVAANGCKDATAEVARAIDGVRVLELPTASKVDALNAADSATHSFPRMYLDADIEIQPDAVIAVLNALEVGPEPAARPPFVYDTTGASWLVRAYFRARMRLPSNTRALWGAGCYALSRAGRDRFGAFPDLIADDLFVDSLFGDHEKRVVATSPVVVRAPRTAAALRAVLRRTYAGNAQLERRLRGAASARASTTSNARDLVASVRSPATFADACVYLVLVLLARVDARRPSSVWGRDHSSRF